VLSVRLLTLCAPQQIEIGPGGRSGDPNTRAKRSYVGVKEFKSQRSSHQDSHGNGLAVCISASKPHPSGRDQPHLTFLHRQITAAHRRCGGGWSARTRRGNLRRREEHCWCRDEALAVAPSGRLLAARRCAPHPGRPGLPRPGSGGRHN
jgi:hypothetical protein